MENEEGRKKDSVEWGSRDVKLVEIIEKAEDTKLKTRLV